MSGHRARGFWGEGAAIAGAALALAGAASAHAAIFGVPTNLTAAGQVQAASVNPPGWFVLTGPNAPSSVGDTVHQLRLFIEVEQRVGGSNETLDVKVFDPGASGARDAAGTTPSTTQYQLFMPAGASLASLTIGDDSTVAPITENRLVRLTGGGFVAANAGAAFANLAAGIYELRVTVTSGDEVNAFGVDIRDAAGVHYNAYTVGSQNAPDTSFVAGTVTGATAPNAAASAPMVLYPYVTRGCSVYTSNYDMDATSNPLGRPSASLMDAFGVSTALDVSGDQLHVENEVGLEPTGTINQESNNYGLFTLSNGAGGDDNRAIDWRVADFQGWNTNPLATPRDPALPVRTYLPNGYAPSGTSANATAPVEPVFASSARVSGGANPPLVGSATQYLITASVSNPGALPIADVKITVPFVAGETFVSSSASVDGGATSCTAERDGGTFRSCRFATLAAGSVASFHVTVSDTPAATGLRNITGAAVLHPVQLTSLTRAGGVATATTAAAHGFQNGDYVTIAGAEQSGYDGLFQVTFTSATTFTYLTVGAPASPATGATILATGVPTVRSVLVVDDGMTRAGGTGTVTVNTTAPHGLLVGDSVTISGANQGAYNGTFTVLTVADADTFTYSVGANRPASPATGTIYVNVPGCPGGLNDPLCATYTPAFSSGANARVEGLGPLCPLSVIVAATNVNLGVTKTASPNPVTAGQNLTYTVTVSNPAISGTALNASLVDPLPANATFQSVGAAAGWSCTTPPVGTRGTLTCTTASMAANTSAAFTIVVRVDPTATGTVTNTATVASLGTDTNPADNTATATVTVSAPGNQADLAITKTDGPDPVVAGNDLTYVIRVTNNGPGAATAPVLSDLLPATTTFRQLLQPSGWSCSTPAVGSTGSVTCTASGAMTAGGSATFVLSVRVNAGATGTISNTASLASTTTDPIPGNNSATAATTIGSAAAPPTCATPGDDGAGGILAGVINTYFPATASAAAFTTSITLGAARGSTTPIAVGDLLLVIQMQDAAINTSDNNTYGDGTASNPANGWTALNSTGLYEYARANSAVPLTGGTLTLTSGLVNSYNNAAYGAQGQRRFQVVRVPQYTSATLDSTLSAAAWDGASGGILVFDVAGTLSLGGATVDVSGEGFHGGGGRRLTGQGGGSNNDYRSLATDDYHAAKGEGIAGAPRFTWDIQTNTLIDNGVEGYVDGSSARGAPGNAGGGGTDGHPAANDENSGGGGGGNGGAGGFGGNSWNSNLAVGGGGGAAFTAAATRIVLGGGGGAGTRNNSSGIHSSGGTGGGIILIRAAGVNGSGTLVANGSDGLLAENDGAGGGGAGGTIVVTTMSGTLSGLTAIARGGRGGDAWPTHDPGGPYPGERHGPGGGGGGGAILLSSAAGSTDVSGGVNGTTTNVRDPYGATAGAVGVVGAAQPSAIPGVDSGAECSSDLAITKTSAPSSPTAGQATYNIVVTNNGFRTATGVTVTDTLPGSVTYVSATPSQGTCSFVSPTLTCALGSVASGASAVVTIVVNATGGIPPTNTASVATTTIDPVDGNNSSTVGPQADLGVTLVGTPEPVAAGTILTYTATVTNNGPNSANGAALTFPLPPSTTFDSLVAPLGWFCTLPAVGDSGTIRCARVTDMPASAVAPFTILVRVDAGAPPNTVIPATVSVTSTNDPFPPNDAATTENTVTGSVALLTRTHVRALRVDPAAGLVEFATGAQRQTVGFNLYATRGPDGPAEGQAPLNGTLVRAVRPDTLSPTLYRVEAPVSSAVYLWIEEIEAAGGRNLMGPFRVGDPRLAAAYARLEAHAEALSAPAIALDRGSSARVLRLGAVRDTGTGRRPISASTASVRRTFVPADGVRIEVDRPGAVHLTVADLQAAGLRARGPMSGARVTLAGRAVPTRVLDAGTSGEALVFAAATLKTVYTASSPYVLTWGDRPLLRVPLTQEGDPEWPGWLRVERSELYVASVPLGTDPWLWDAIGFDGPTWPTFDPSLGSFTLPPLVAGADDVPVRIRVLGYGPYRHEIHASINGVPVGGVVVEGTAPALIEGVVPRAALIDPSSGDGQNALTMTYASDAPEPGLGWAYLDHLDLLVRPQPPAETIVPPRLTAWNPTLPRLDDSDYLIVTHPRFAASAARLAALERAAGHRVAVVDVERAYDHFSAGIVEAEAVHALIREAARGGRLRYVLLFGDDTFDYWNETGTGAVSYVPSLYGWDGVFGRVPSETRFADVDGDGSPDVAIGRLPAQDEDEAGRLVDKIQRQAITVRALAGRNVFVVDRDDPTPGTPSFAHEAAAVAARIGGAIVAWANGGGDTNVARETLFNGLASGAAFTHVFAHGAPWQWGNAGLLTVDDVEGAGGTPPKLGKGPETIVLTWACEAQYYTYLGETVDEALLLRPDGGALAAFGPAGIVDMAVQATLYQRLYEELHTAPTLGDAVRRAKSRALAEDSRAWPAVAGWNLLGDPALPLRSSASTRRSMPVDSIVGGSNQPGGAN